MAKNISEDAAAKAAFRTLIGLPPVKSETKGKFLLMDCEIQSASGYITANGTVTDHATTKACVPIEIPDGVNAIYIESTDYEAAPNYVNCYSEAAFGGFLGRSDDKEYASLVVNAASVGIKHTLQPGTKFISFMCATSSYNLGRTIIKGDSTVLTSTLSFGSDNITLNNPAINFKTPYIKSNIRFQVPVNCNLADNITTGTTLQDAENINMDWGVLMLPESYSNSGKSTQLIVGCHGASGSVDGVQSQTETYNIYKYLVANDFAVMDMNGLPAAFATSESIDIKNNIGSPIAVEAYIKGIKWVLDNYNIDPDSIIVFGVSMGGISSSNLVMSGRMKFMAHGMICPVLDTYNHIWLNPWSSGAPKTAMIKIYRFEETSEGSGTYVYDEDKLKGFNPLLNGMLSFDSDGALADNVEVATATALTDLTEIKKYPCPVKIWHGDADATVAYNASQRHINSIRKGGQEAYLRTIASGTHEVIGAGSTLASPLGNTDYKGATLTIKPVEEEMFLWANRFKK